MLYLLSFYEKFLCDKISPDSEKTTADKDARSEETAALHLVWYNFIRSRWKPSPNMVLSWGDLPSIKVCNKIIRNWSQMKVAAHTLLPVLIFFYCKAKLSPNLRITVLRKDPLNERQNNLIGSFLTSCMDEKITRTLQKFTLACFLLFISIK